MKKKTFLGAFLMLLLVATLTNALSVQQSKSEPTTIRVPQNYPRIQEAINAANDGDTIFVQQGAYYEHVVVNKSVSLIGEEKSTTVIDGNNTGDVIKVTSADVKLTGFTIRHSSPFFYPYSGIALSVAAARVNISSNIITTNCNGIRLYNSSNNSIHNNHITGSYFYGIEVSESSYNRIYGNNITTSGAAILLNSSDNNQVSKNELTANRYEGILASCSSNNTIECNTFANNQNGILMLDSNFNNNISSNNITSNVGVGIILYSTHTLITRNNIAKNGLGILVDLRDSPFPHTNSIHHNYFINNTNQTEAKSFCLWDDGYPSGGNFWSNYWGRDNYHGVYQNISGSDGKGDVPYFVFSNNTDRYPLMSGPNGEVPMGMMQSFISIVSPENTTYYVGEVQLSFTVAESVSWTGVSIDNRRNMTIFGNTTLYDLANGAHSIRAYTKDKAGNQASSSVIYFSVNEPHPEPVIPIVAAVVIIMAIVIVIVILGKKSPRQ